MDLLKDYNYVPTTDQNDTQYYQVVKNLINKLSGLVADRTRDYDFMDLLVDNGYVPINDNWIKSNSNDNDQIIDIAS